MPKVEQYDWDKLRPKTIEKPSKQGTKQFSTYEYKEPHKRSKNGAVKVTRPPKQKRTRAIDPTIANYHDNALRGFFKNI